MSTSSSTTPKSSDTISEDVRSFEMFIDGQWVEGQVGHRRSCRLATPLAASSEKNGRRR